MVWHWQWRGYHWYWLLIHLFAAWYMKGDTGFACSLAIWICLSPVCYCWSWQITLFLLYLGWEGVGICLVLYWSVLLPWPRQWSCSDESLYGDAGVMYFSIRSVLLFREFGTLNIQEIITRAPEVFDINNPTMMLTTMMLVAAMGNPLSCRHYIHGLPMRWQVRRQYQRLFTRQRWSRQVYLIARLHPFVWADPGDFIILGRRRALTLVVAGFCALAQTDIKRILAYSTMSQIGYVLALALARGKAPSSIWWPMLSLKPCYSYHQVRLSLAGTPWAKHL